MSTGRVLIVEDEAMVLLMVELAVMEAGLDIVGPAGRLDDALALARSETFDAAVLDVNLAGELVFPLADELAAAGRPFLFVTGYGRAGIPDRFADRPVVEKPFEPEQVGRMLRTILAWA